MPCLVSIQYTLVIILIALQFPVHVFTETCGSLPTGSLHDFFANSASSSTLASKDELNNSDTNAYRSHTDKQTKATKTIKIKKKQQQDCTIRQCLRHKGGGREEQEGGGGRE